MKINILGTEYAIEKHSYHDDVRLNDCYGYCDWTTKKIVLTKETACVNLGDKAYFIKKVLRHEIVHAFFLESGLHECSGEAEAWAANETMVDWFARQGPKIYKVWLEAGAL